MIKKHIIMLDLSIMSKGKRFVRNLYFLRSVFLKDETLIDNFKLINYDYLRSYDCRYCMVIVKNTIFRP